MIERLDAATILGMLALGFFICMGWSVFTKLWALLGDRGQLIVSIVVLVAILVAVVLAYRA